jgi:chromosome segregation ATPase
MTASEIADLQEELKELQSRVDFAEKECEEAETERDTALVRVDTLEDRVDELEEELEEAQKSLANEKDFNEAARAALSALDTFLSWLDSPPPGMSPQTQADYLTNFRRDLDDARRQVP